jgi:hypothetical protein
VDQAAENVDPFDQSVIVHAVSPDEGWHQPPDVQAKTTMRTRCGRALLKRSRLAGYSLRGARKSANPCDLTIRAGSYVAAKVKLNTFGSANRLFERVQRQCLSAWVFCRRPSSKHLTEFSSPTGSFCGCRANGFGAEALCGCAGCDPLLIRRHGSQDPSLPEATFHHSQQPVTAGKPVSNNPGSRYESTHNTGGMVWH